MSNVSVARYPEIRSSRIRNAPGISATRATIRTALTLPAALALAFGGLTTAAQPAEVDAAALTEKEAGGVAIDEGETRLTVTVPGAEPDAWLGVTFYSEPLFAGWFKPNSSGVIDVNLPENLPVGEHRLVIASEDLTPLIAAAIGVGILAIAAVAFLVIVLVRTRRSRAIDAGSVSGESVAAAQAGTAAVVDTTARAGAAAGIDTTGDGNTPAPTNPGTATASDSTALKGDQS